MGIESAHFIPGGITGRVQPDAMDAAATGLFMGGQVVKENNPMSLLADAAEELTFSLAESEESRLDERREKAEKKVPSRFFLDAASRALQHLDEKSRRALNNLERLFKFKNTMELSELMQALGDALQKEGAGSDAADRFVLLAGLKESLGADHPLADTLDAAMDALASGEPAAIASGLASDMSAPEFAELGEGRELRSVYRDVLADFSSPRDVLTRLLARFGKEHLDRGIDFLMTALGHEMSSAAPSEDRTRLKALTGDLAAVRVLGTVNDRCCSILDRLDRAHGIKSRIGPNALLDAVLALRDNQYVGSQDFDRIVSRVSIPDTERKVLFLQDMQQGLRELPDLFYDGNTNRMQVLDAAQVAVDEAVRREEEELGF